MYSVTLIKGDWMGVNGGWCVYCLCLVEAFPAGARAEETHWDTQQHTQTQGSAWIHPPPPPPPPPPCLLASSASSSSTQTLTPRLPFPGLAASHLLLLSCSSFRLLLSAVSFSLSHFLSSYLLDLWELLLQMLWREVLWWGREKKKDIYWYRQPKFLCLIIFVVFLGRMSWGCYQSQYL